MQIGAIAICVMVSIDHGAALSDNPVKASMATQMAIDAAVYGNALAAAGLVTSHIALVSRLITRHAEACAKRARESLNL